MSIILIDVKEVNRFDDEDNWDTTLYWFTKHVNIANVIHKYTRSVALFHRTSGTNQLCMYVCEKWRIWYSSWAWSLHWLHAASLMMKRKPCEEIPHPGHQATHAFPNELSRTEVNPNRSLERRTQRYWSTNFYFSPRTSLSGIFPPYVRSGCPHCSLT